MFFSISSLISNNIFINVLLVCIFLKIKKNHRFLFLHSKWLSIFIILALLRLIFPFELPMTYSYRSQVVFASIRDFFIHSIFTINGFEVNLGQIVFLVWGIGALIKLLDYFTSYRQIHRIISCSKLDESQETQEIMKTRLEKSKITSQILVYRVDGNITPCILGFFHPKILIPEEDYTYRELYYILNHEITHYIHGDILKKNFIYFLSALYWWNPILSHLQSEMDKAMEAKVDQVMISSFYKEEDDDYFLFLLNYTKKRRESVYSEVAALTNKSFTLVERYKFLMEENLESLKNKRRDFVLFFFLLLIFIASNFIVIEPHYPDPPDAENTFSLTRDNAYVKRNEQETFDIYYNNEYLYTTEVLDADLTELEVKEE